MVFWFESFCSHPRCGRVGLPSSPVAAKPLLHLPRVEHCPLSSCLRTNSSPGQCRLDYLGKITSLCFPNPKCRLV